MQGCGQEKECKAKDAGIVPQDAGSVCACTIYMCLLSIFSEQGYKLTTMGTMFTDCFF